MRRFSLMALPAMLAVPACGARTPLEPSPPQERPSLCSAPLVSCDGRCIDTRSDMTNCGACGRACSITAPSVAVCEQSRCVATLYDGPVIDPSHLALNSEAVYWSNLYEILTAPLQGGAVTTLVEKANGVLALAVDASSLYWAQMDGDLLKLPLGGGSPSTLASGPGLHAAIAIALSHESVYWAPRAVMRVPLDGSPATTVASEEATALATDETNVYWMASGSVKKEPLMGGVITTLAKGQFFGAALVVNRVDAVWASAGSMGTVDEVSLAGGVTKTLVPAQSYLDDVTADEEHVYWAIDSGSVSPIQAIPVGGGAARTVFSPRDGYIPSRILVDATSVYWILVTGDGRAKVMKATPK